MSQFIKFYFTSSMLNTFWVLIPPSSGAATFLLYHHIGCVFLFRCVLEFFGVAGWGGIRVAGCFSLPHGYYSTYIRIFLNLTLGLWA